MNNSNTATNTNNNNSPAIAMNNPIPMRKGRIIHRQMSGLDSPKAFSIQQSASFRQKLSQYNNNSSRQNLPQSSLSSRGSGGDLSQNRPSSSSIKNLVQSHQGVIAQHGYKQQQQQQLFRSHNSSVAQTYFSNEQQQQQQQQLHHVQQQPNSPPQFFPPNFQDSNMFLMQSQPPLHKSYHNANYQMNIIPQPPYTDEDYQSSDHNSEQHNQQRFPIHTSPFQQSLVHAYPHQFESKHLTSPKLEPSAAMSPTGRYPAGMFPTLQTNSMNSGQILPTESSIVDSQQSIQKPMYTSSTTAAAATSPSIFKKTKSVTPLFSIDHSSLNNFNSTSNNIILTSERYKNIMPPPATGPNASSQIKTSGQLLSLLDYLVRKHMIMDACDIFIENCSAVSNLSSMMTSISEQQRIFDYAVHFHRFACSQMNNNHAYVDSSSMFGQVSMIYQGNMLFHTATPAPATANSANDLQNILLNHTDQTSSNSAQTTSRKSRGSSNKYQSIQDWMRAIEVIQMLMERIIESSENENSSKQQIESIVSQKILYLNEVSVNNLRRHEYSLSFEQFQLLGAILLSSNYGSSPSAAGIITASILNNAAVGHILHEDLRTAESLLTKSIELSESRVFPTMKDIAKEFLQDDPLFLAEIPVLVFGYLYLEFVSQRISVSSTQENLFGDGAITSMTTPNSGNTASSNYLKNANSITKKYFGSSHQFTKKVNVIASMIQQVDCTVFHILSECGAAFNEASIRQICRFRSFKSKVFLDASSQLSAHPSKKLFLSIISSNQNNQSSTRISSEPSFLIRKGGALGSPQYGLISQLNAGQLSSQVNLSGRQTSLAKIPQSQFAIEDSSVVGVVRSDKRTMSNLSQFNEGNRGYYSSLGNDVKRDTNQENSEVREEYDQSRLYSDQDMEQLPIQEQNQILIQKSKKEGTGVPVTVATKSNDKNAVTQQDIAHVIEKNINNALSEFINSTKQLQNDKAQSGQEITQLKQMMGQLLESQKNSNQQIQQQQKQLMETQAMQLHSLEQQKKNELLLLSARGSQSKLQLAHSKHSSGGNLNAASKPAVLSLFKILNQTTKESITLSKQVFFNNAGYTIKCMLNKSGKLQISAYTLAEATQPIATESIEKDMLMQLIGKVNYESVLPHTLSLNMCETMYHFNRFFILPFASVDPSKKEIKFTQTPSGLLSKTYERTFLGEKVMQSLHFIEGNTYRLILARQNTSKSSRNNILKIDLDLDIGSQKKWLDLLNLDSDFSKEEIKCIDNLTQHSSDPRNEDLKEMQQRSLKTINSLEIKNIQASQLNQSSAIRSCRILSESTFIKELDDMVAQLEELLISLSITSMDNLFKSPFFLRVKIWSITQKRQIQLCIDDQEKEVRVVLKNIYFTFGVGGQKLKAQGVSTTTYTQIQQIYGIDYSGVSLVEKIVLLSQLPEFYTLNVHEKNDDNLENAKSTKQSQNPIIKVIPVSGAFSRKHYKYVPATVAVNSQQQQQQYLHPITLEIIGASQKLLGVRVLLYNYSTCQETGVFLTVEDQHWAFENKVLLKNSFHLYLESLPLSQFFLPHIFEEIVVPLIMKKISIEEDERNPSALKLKLNTGLVSQNATNIYRIENLVSVQEIIRNYSDIVNAK